MKKVILKYKGHLNGNGIEGWTRAINNDLEKLGFAVVDDQFEVFVIDDGKEEKDANHVENLG